MFQIAEIFIEQIQIKENTDLNITMEGIQHAFILEYYAVYTPSQLTLLCMLWFNGACSDYY